MRRAHAGRVEVSSVYLCRLSGEPCVCARGRMRCSLVVAPFRGYNLLQTVTL